MDRTQGAQAQASHGSASVDVDGNGDEDVDLDVGVKQLSSATRITSPGAGPAFGHSASSMLSRNRIAASNWAASSCAPGHMNISPTAGDFRGVVGTPCGQCGGVPEPPAPPPTAPPPTACFDSSSKVTIFSLRGFRVTICSCAGGGGGCCCCCTVGAAEQSSVWGGPNWRPCGRPMPMPMLMPMPPIFMPIPPPIPPPPPTILGEYRRGGGRARSPTPDRLNSLMLRGTKYSRWCSGMPVDLRMGVFRWKADPPPELLAACR
ncbi:GD16799 [Drosophila simulans]|uniref:GD16799 n=1 Tax=Drosophila simulans TaxID=7240 RepID=B4R5L7_DROSI|nr:GD16799 [Drosophila simulans]